MNSRTPLICEVARRRGSVIVDMNVILEVRQIGSWCALTGGYFIETPEDCVTETQAGFQGRRPEQRSTPGSCVRRLRCFITSKSASAQNCHSGFPAVHWIEMNLRFGVTHSTGVTFGCRADQTRPAFVAAFGSVFVNSSFHWSGFSMMSDIGPEQL